MKYHDGTEVQVGDVITVERDSGIKALAAVVEIVQPNTKEAEQWSLLEGGILMEGGGLGSFVSSSLEEDSEIVFVRRAK
jgi:hypothetical protein